MPKFLDVHPMKGFEEQTIMKAISESSGEFGVTTENALNKVDADRLYCILDTPNKEAIERHHKKYGAKCEWIMEIMEIMTNA